MMRLAFAAPIGGFFFLTLLALAGFTTRAGFVPDDSIMLWAGSIAAGDGEVSIGHMVSAYPSIPFLATTLVQFLTPGGAPAPALVAALVLTVLAGLCFITFCEVGWPIPAAMIAAVLIFGHPALLRAAMAGPADMFLAAFLLLLAKGLYDLRAHSAAPEVILVAFALAGLAFSHPMGAAIAIGSVPFLVLAVRPALVANSALNVIVALVFPTIFAAGAFVYVSWVFPGSGWSFFALPSESLAAWAVSRTSAWTGSLTFDAAFAVAAALAIGAPVVLAAVAWVHRRRPLVTPVIVLAASTIAAAGLAAATGAFGEPVALASAAPIVAAIVLIRIPDARAHMAVVLVLLVLGWIGGAAGLSLLDPRMAARFGNMNESAAADRERIDALNLGHVTTDKEGVLVDSFATPAVVLGRGSARGLFAPQGEAFSLTMLFAKLDAPLVAVPDPQSLSGAQDQLNKLFPNLYRSGAPGYRLVYQNPTWRLFERIGKAPVSKP